jgi:hypothetical protein
VQVGEVAGKGFQPDAHLETGEMYPQAEVSSGGKGEVGVGIAYDIEAERVIMPQPRSELLLRR